MTVLYQHSKTVGGHLIRRYKRFLADVRIGDADSSQVVFVPNTGSMAGLLDRENASVVLSMHDGKSKRKYSHTLEMIQPAESGAWVGIHSALANKLTRKLLEEKKVPGVDSYTSEDVQPEVPIQPFLRKGKNTSKRPQGGKTSSAPGKTRVDFRIQHTGEVTGRRMAVFPDCKSDRALKHIQDLQALVEAGHKGVCAFVVQRNDCVAFAPCMEKDPEYAQGVREAAANGVKLVALLCEPKPDGSIHFVREIPIEADWQPEAYSEDT